MTETSSDHSGMARSGLLPDCLLRQAVVRLAVELVGFKTPSYLVFDSLAVFTYKVICAAA